MDIGNNGTNGQPTSGPGETAEANPPTINWPAWLEEYYQADQADRIAGRLADVFGRENDPEIAKLKETERTAQARLRDVVSRIEEAPADSQEALAVKMAVAWNYHTDFPLDQNNELTNELGGDLVLLQTSLDALAVQTGLSLFEIYGRDGPSVYPDPNDEPDAGLLWLEREHRRLVHYAENAPGEGLSDEDQDASTARQAEIKQEVARTIAKTPKGVAAKMRLLSDEYESLKSAWADEAWETCLTSLERMGDDVKVAVAVEPEAEIGTASPDANNDDPNADYLEGDHPEPTNNADAPLIALAQEHDQLEASIKNLSEEETGKRASRMLEIAREIWERPADTLHGVAAKLRVLRYHSPISREDEESCFDTCLATLAQVLGGASRDVAVPDAALFTLEVEMKAAYDGLRADPGGNDEHQVWYDRIDAAEKAAQATPAQTAAGVLAKLRMAAHYQNPKPDPDHDEVFDGWTRHIIEEAQRIGATVPADPDTELLDLWSQHQALCGAWPADATDEESDRHGNRINQVELQIAATPANSLAGIAIKLQVAAIDVVSADDVPCARNVVSARDDAMRLTGLGGAL